MADDSSWTPKQDMSLLCRVCANQHDYLIPIFEGEGLDHDMPTKMDKHLPITVRENDKLPTQMCYQCASTIIAWSELVTNCLEADKKLSRMLKINEKKAGTVALVDEDATSDHYEDAYDDVGGGDDYDDAAADDEDFEKEIKQLISDAGVELGSKTTKAKTTRATTRKRKSETVIVKKESKKSKTDTSVGKSSISLIKPKEEVTASDDRNKIQIDKNPMTRVHIASKDILEPSVLQMEQAGHNTTNSLSVVLLPELNLNKSNPKDKNFECKKCHNIFQTNRKMHDHLRQSHKIHIPDRYRFDCCFCSAIFYKKKEYHIHLTEEHDQKVSERHRFQLCACSDCGKMFYNSATLKMHMKAVHSERTFECGPCGKTFRTKKYLREHMKRLHMDKSRQQKLLTKPKTKPALIEKEKPLKCNLCGTCFENNRQVAGHRVNCAFYLLKPQNVEGRAHVTEAETNEDKLIIMPKIGHHVVNRNDTNRVSKIGQANSSGPPYVCVHCDKAYMKKGSFYMHLSTKHSSKKRETTQCEMCGKHVLHLSIHMRQVHLYPEVRPHMCDLCGACFKKIGALRTHRVIHTGEKFPCPVCGRGFTQRGDMRKHARALHDLVVPTNSNETDTVILQLHYEKEIATQT